VKAPLDSDLMAFADGELDELESRELEARLGRDATLRGKVDGVGEIGEVVRGHLELSADAVPQKKFDALWREIDKAIERDTADAREPAKAAAVEGGLLRRIGRWFDRYRGHVLTGAVSAGAVAALALLLRNPAGSPDGGGLADGSARSGGNQPTLVNYQPTEIESLDTPDGTGTVFNLEDEDGSTTVIWVTPEDTVEGI
jgi:hypothetical protein